MPDGLCPLCLTPQQTLHHNLLCTDCVGQQSNLVRNSCIESDRQIQVSRAKINHIFDICQRLEDEQEVSELPKDTLTPNPSLKLIKSLSYRLIKLKGINTKAKLRNIERSTTSLQSSILNIQKELDSLTASEPSAPPQNIEALYTQRHKQLDNDIQQMRDEKLTNVERQTVLLQRQKYMALMSLAFSGPLSITGAGAKFQMTPGPFLFCMQPVINLEDLFNHNSKVIQINEFFENLIKYQLNLAEVFKVDGVELPFLGDLLKLLPDEQLFSAIQDQENFVVNGSSEQDDLEPSLEPNPDDNNEQIIRLGDAFKLPLSSKTINLQRRARTERSAEPESPKADTTKGSSRKKSSLYGKSVVIVPHKILTKPFTRFSTQEFLRFLLIVAKIIVNFLYFFEMTTNKDSRQLHMYTARMGERDEYSFSQMLVRLCKMKTYFDYKLNILKNDKPTTESTGNNSLVSTASNGSSASSSMIPLLSNYVNIRSKRSHGLLERFFGEDRKHGNDSDIYGGVSEASLGKNSDILPKHDDRIPDLKTIMQAVYRIMVSGATSKTRKFSSTTYSMMAESKEQLDDWDVVSKLH